MVNKINKDPATSAESFTDNSIVPENKSNVKVVIPMKDLIYAFADARDRIKEMEEAFDREVEPLKKAKAELQAEIIKTFKERGEFSARVEGATASLSVRKTAVVVDEEKVIHNLKQQKLNEYISESLNGYFDGAKKQMASGEVPLIDGIVIKETEFVSVRLNTKAEPRKVTTEKFVRVERGENGK